jgi:D-alanyl-D-alanine endopeptidase (penicillin-binding protein 7)
VIAALGGSLIALGSLQAVHAGGVVPKSRSAAQPALKSKAGGAAQPALKSNAALVLDQSSGEVLYGKNAHAVVPIASISKLMTAMVVLDADLDAEELVEVTDEDVDWLRGSSSRLQVGSVLTRDQLLRLALMASENRAAAALSRAYPDGRPAFVAAMNAKARSLGLHGTRFLDSTGLSSGNVSTAGDLATMVAAAHTYPKIREYSTLAGLDMQVGRRTISFHNTNRLVANPAWEIGLSKTGFIREAGKCLVMQARFVGRAVIVVLLDASGSPARLADASRIRKWMEAAAGVRPAPAPQKASLSHRPRHSAAGSGKARRI